MNSTRPAPPQPGDDLKQSRNGTWFAYGMRDLRKEFIGKKDLAGTPYAEYSEAEVRAKAAYRYYPKEHVWRLWACFRPDYLPRCHEFE